MLIGVPNAGAPLEVFANLTSAVLWSLPIPATRFVGLGLDHRSAGIKDLRFGAILDEDWLEQDPGALERPPAPHEAPLPRAQYLIIAGCVTADPGHPLARLIVDTLVTSSSAAGIDHMTGEELFPGATVRLFPKVNHIALANRLDVYDEIDRWWPAIAHGRRARPGST